MNPVLCYHLPFTVYFVTGQNSDLNLPATSPLLMLQNPGSDSEMEEEEDDDEEGYISNEKENTAEIREGDPATGVYETADVSEESVVRREQGASSGSETTEKTGEFCIRSTAAI